MVDLLYTAYGTPPRGPKGARAIEDVIQAAERAEMALGGPVAKPTPQTMDIEAPLFVSRWSFRPTNANCLRLRAGDVVKVVDRSHSEWWYGVTNGSAGYFPGNYVTPTKPRQESVTEPPTSLIWAPEKEKEAKAAGLNAPEDVLMQALFSNNT